MAPGYRTTATNTRRGNRSGIPEHDDFEGLPVRQWRQQLVTVAPPPEREENKKHDRWAVELPHGMPRDAHLLPPHTQELLRLARSGKLYKKRPLPEEDDADAEGAPGDKQEKKDSAASEGYSFKVRKWVRLERSAEDPGINLLAPRHKNTIMRPSKQLGTQVTGPMVTKATVKRIDAAGNPYTQEVIVPDGQAVDGEIISTSVVPAPEAAGEAVLPIATPARRKPPIPQKKKGRGRGRGGRGRGRLTLATPTRPVPQQDGSTEAKPEKVGPDGVKIESEDASRAAGDIEMNESSALDDDDGDEGSGDDDEGDGDESGTPAAEGEDQEMKDAPPYPPPDSAADSHAAPGTTSAEAPHPDVNLAPPQLVTDPVHLEGSPLKHVTLRSPTDPSPHLSPIATASAAAAAADATASADTGLSGVPGESTLGLQPSVPEPQQPVLLSQAFFRERIVDKNPAEPPGPVPAPVEAAPVEDSRMDEITSANPKPQGTGAEPIPVRSAVLFTGAELLPVVEPPPALESLPSAEPLHVLERPPVVEAPPVVEPPPTHAEELPQAPHKEDLPLPSSEEPMPGQMVEYSEQQVPPAAEPALPSPIMAPAPAPVPSPPLVPQVPVGEAMGDVGSGDVKVESGGADSAPAEGDSTTHVVINDAGAADVGAEKFGSQDAGDKDVLGVDGTRAGEVSTKDAETEDVVTEDVATEDGSFDILGSLSTSLNQQAEDDAPPAPIPAGPAETAASKPAQPAQPEETVPAATTEETGPAGQTSEAARTDHAEEAGEASKNNEPTQAEQTINTKEGQAPTQERPEKNEEQV